MAEYYLNKKVIVTLTGLIFSVFGGGVIIHYIRKIAHRMKISGSGEPVFFPDVEQRRIGYLERFFLTLGMILGGWLLILVPLAVIPRLLIWNEGGGREFLIINLMAGVVISMGTGAIVHLVW